jgi:pyruvate/2-oxoglutarate/acetoin dehydrogenase E1 component
MPETMSYAAAVREALRTALRDDPNVTLSGEDIGIYGGAFGISEGLLEEFGKDRIIDTPISEEAAVGAGVGAAITGMRPIVEMQFSDFIANAIDPLVNQAAKLHFMYGGGTAVPMVVRGPAGGGTGAAAQHSQSLEAWFAHIPGLKVVMPAFPQDAHDLLLVSVADANPVVFFEHKVLYKTSGPVEVRAHIADAPEPLGRAKVVREGGDLTIAAYSIMAVRALEAASELADRGIDAEVLDLRTLRPLDIETVRTSVRKTGRLLVTHEAPAPVGVGAEVIAGVVESDALDYLLAPAKRVCGRDNPMPYADNLEKATIPQVADVVTGAAEVMED